MPNVKPRMEIHKLDEQAYMRIGDNYADVTITVIYTDAAHQICA